MAGAVVFLMTANDSFYRWALREAIAGRIDREIAVDGSFSFEMGLEPSLTVTDVRFANADWASAPDMARARRIEVQVALAPLLTGVVRIPRLVVDGLELSLERAADGKSNWQMASDVETGPDDIAPDVTEDQSISYPIAEVFSFTDISIAYRDRQSGQETDLFVEHLTKTQEEGGEGIGISGSGRLNERDFEISGRYGSIEQALSASAPYPFALTLRSANTVSQLEGTVDNLPAARGIDARVNIRAQALDDVMQHLRLDLPIAGRAEASARLVGDLASLAVEMIDVKLADPTGRELRISGRVADISQGRGLDLAIDGALEGTAFEELLLDVPALALPDGSQASESARLDLVGRLTGSLAEPVVESLEAQLQHASGAQLTIDGRGRLDLLDDRRARADFESAVLLVVPDKALAEGLVGQPLPDLGAIRADAEIAWSGDEIVLRSGELQADALGQWEIAGEGKLGKLSARDFALSFAPQLLLRADIPETRALISLVDRVLAARAAAHNEADPVASLTGPALVLAAQLRLKAAGFPLEQADGRAGPKTRRAIEDFQQGNGLTVDGEVTPALIRSLDSWLSAAGLPIPAAPEPADASRAASLQALPELGPLALRVTLSAEQGGYLLDALDLRIGEAAGPSLKAGGSLGRLDPESGAALQDIALTVAFAVPSTAPFAALLPPEVPPFTGIDGRFALLGSSETLALDDAVVTAEGPEGLGVELSGRVGKLLAAGELAAQDMALNVETDWPTTAALAALAGIALPELGPVTAKGTLRDRGERYSFVEIEARAGEGDASAVEVAGEIGDLAALTQTTLKGTFNLPTATLLASVTEDTAARAEATARGQGPGALGLVGGNFELSDTDGSLGVESFRAESRETQLFALALKGAVDSLEARDDIWLETTLTVPAVSRLRQELGLEPGTMGDFNFKGTIAGKDEQLQGEAKIEMGESELSGTLSGTWEDDKPVLTASLTSPHIQLADIGLAAQSEAQSVEPAAPEAQPEPSQAALPPRQNAIGSEATDDSDVARPAQPEPGAAGESQGSAPSDEAAVVPQRIFGEEEIAFEALRNMDLVLDILLEDIEGTNLEIERIKAVLDLADGQLSLNPLTFNFVGGRVDASIDVDASSDLPELRLRLAADDVHLGDFFAQTQVDVPLEGDLDLLVELDAAGRSPRAIASSLDGEFDMAIERGRLKTGLLRLAATDVVSWMFTSDAREGYSDLNCAIVRFDIAKGLAQSQTLLLDTENVQAIGEGTIDLGQETIGIEVVPQPKNQRFVKVATPFAIRGPLAKPEVDVSISGAVARNVGQIILKPVTLLDSLLPLVIDSGEDADNPCLTLQQGLARQ